MLPKPDTCRGCPLYGDGRGFVPDELREAPVMVLAQNPGESEETGQRWDGERQEPRPLIGATGRVLWTTYAPLAGLSRESVSVANVLRCRQQTHCRTRCNHLPTGETLRRAVEHCQRHYFQIPSATRLIVAMGALAWETLAPGLGSITAWRGFLAPTDFQGRMVYAVLHLADLFHQPTMVLPSQRDWSKIPAILGGRWPSPIPPFMVVSQETLHTSVAYLRRAAEAPWVVMDTEYEPTQRHLTMIGLYDPSQGQTLLMSWQADHPAEVRRAYMGALRSLIGQTPVVFQNAQADLLVLQKYGIDWSDFRQIEDTLCAHALLWSDWPHDLAFLASVYGQYPKLKHLATTDPYLYLHGDLLATADVWQALDRELGQDLRVARIYRQWLLPLIPQFVRATTLGVRVDQEMARQALAQLDERQQEAERQARAWCGYPINLASPVQVTRHWQIFDRLRIARCDLETLHRWGARVPDNGLLQARRQWAETEGFRRYVMSVAESETVHPEFLPTQATGRISVTNPPLVNFPDDGKAIKRGLPPLQAIFRPRPGHWWVCWDWSALHARIMAAACGDEEDLRAFREGLDIHLITACRVFRLPLPPNLTDPDHPDNAEWRAQVGWQPKDRRRHLVKTVRYALLNGLSAKAVRESKEAVEQGIDLDELERVGRQFLAAKPAMGRWKAQYIAQALRAGEARSLYGRKRRLLGSGDGGSEERQKAAISGFLQMTEVDILEETLARIFREDPDARLVYPSHDGVRLEYPNSRDPREVWSRWRPWVERPHHFGLHSISFPAEWSAVFEDGHRERLSENGDH